MIRRRLGVAVLVVGLVASFLVPGLFPRKASAVASPPFDVAGCSTTATGQKCTNYTITAKWIDKAHIAVTITGSIALQNGAMVPIDTASGTYYDQNVNDNNYDYQLNGAMGSSACDSFGNTLQFNLNAAPFDGNGGNARIDVNAELFLAVSNGGKCYDEILGDGAQAGDNTYHIGVENDAISNPTTGIGSHVGTIGYIQADANTIIAADNDPNYDKTSDKAEIFVAGNDIYNKQTLADFQAQAGNGDCHHSILLDSANPGTSFPIRASVYSRAKLADGSCLPDATPVQFIYVLSSNDYQIGTGKGSTAGTVDSSGAITQDTCDITNTALRYVACPLEAGGSQAVTYLSKGILSQLIFNTDDIYSGPHADAYHQAWNSFRILSLSVLLIAGTVMVVSEALGLELTNAYAFRKIIWFLMLSAIFGSLSWTLGKYAFISCNDITTWVKDFISEPFKSLTYSSGNAGTIGVGSVVVDDSVALFGLVTLGFVGLLSLLATAVISLLFGYFILILRQQIAVFGLILSAFFIMLNTMPFTRKGYKIWADTMIGVWVSGPLVMGFFTITDIGVVFLATNPATRPFAFPLYCYKCFLLIAILKIPSGLLATATGKAHGAVSGVQGMLKKQRSGIRKSRLEAAKRGDLYEGKRWIPGSRHVAGAINSTTARVGVGAGNNFGFGRRGKAAYSNAMATYDEEYANSAMGKANRFKDNANRALTFKDETDARQNMARVFARRNDDGTYTNMSQADVEQGIAEAKASGGWAPAKRLSSFNALAASGTGFDNVGQGARVAAMIAGDNDDILNRNVGSLRALSGQARGDIAAASHATVLGLAQEAQRNNGTIDEAHVVAAETEAGQSMSYAAYHSMKAGAVRNVSRATNQTINVVENERQRLAARPDGGGEANDGTGRTRAQVASDAVTELVAHTENIGATTMYGSNLNTRTANQNLIQQQTTINATTNVHNNIDSHVPAPAGSPIAVGAQINRNAQQAAVGNVPNANVDPAINAPANQQQRVYAGNRVGVMNPNDPSNPNRQP